MVEAVNLIEDDLAAGIFQILPDLPWVRARKKRKLAEGTSMMHFVVERARRNAKKTRSFELSKSWISLKKN